MIRFLILLGLLAGLATPAQAHKSSDSYLTLALDGEVLEGRWDIALRDLDFALGLDSDGDGAITWGELRARHPAIAAYALGHLNLGDNSSACRLVTNGHRVVRHSDGAYAVLDLTGSCPAGLNPLKVSYSLLFDLDRQHRGIARIRQGDHTEGAIFGPENPVQTFAAVGSPAWRSVTAFFLEGVWHIWIGFDHILFLVTLLLPAVMALREGRWQPVEGLPAALLSTTKIVTAFTVAHSLTLSLAALDLISLPSRLVESAIAASVVLAALNNLWPLVTRRLWLVAFGFGLIHGFGFASVLSDLGLPAEGLALALLGFNLGVEAGQIAIVAGFLPLAYGLRHSFFYKKVALPTASATVAGLGGLWLVERSFALNLFGT